MAPNTLPTARVHTAAGGWLTLHASRMRGDPATQPITIVVEPAESHTLVGMALSAHNLSPREQEVARLGAQRRLDHRDLRRAAHLPAHRPGPPQVGVRQGRGRSRRDLVGLLLGSATNARARPVHASP